MAVLPQIFCNNLDGTSCQGDFFICYTTFGKK